MNKEEYDALRKERCQGEYAYIAVKEELIQEIKARGVVILGHWVDDAIRNYLDQTKEQELDDKYKQKETYTSPEGYGTNPHPRFRARVGRSNWRKEFERPQPGDLQG